MADIVHLDGIWTKFLELWPVEKVRAMTLEQYHSLRECPAYILLYQFSPKDTGQSKVK